MKSFNLHSISPIDGRYSKKTKILKTYFSEFSLIYHRLKIEIYWLKSLINNKKIKNLNKLNDKEQKYLKKILSNFNESEAKKIKNYEKKTNHDLKAIEYYLIDKFKKSKVLQQYTPYIHFACTSEDINNLSYTIMIKDAVQYVIQPVLSKTIDSIVTLAKKYDNIPMLSRTHGQPASTTTIGKEMVVFLSRLEYQKNQLSKIYLSAKFNGAVGNYNAHIIAFPKINWIKHCKKFINSFKLPFNNYTTQIEPHDNIAELCHLMTRINNILLDYTRDIWYYVSINYFSLKIFPKETGSSTMPHKNNPIEFENAEGNLSLSNALFTYFANKLTKSRLQRDLSGSTVLRNIGVPFSHTIIAYKSIIKGNKKILVNHNIIKKDLNNNWKIMSEAIQTVMRKYKIPNAYEKIKKTTRGKTIDKNNIKKIIQNLNLPIKIKNKLNKLNPEKYIGLSKILSRNFYKNFNKNT
ncbi:adenylosuccinate lyase [Candidatus Legionella polyplacis]|uniref:Adenylosuccinate lyase n=1 Tax=Candidatus Legionella polyplacis TaxID=2005262 RepID=A0ABZ2GWG5_9GAMM